MGLSEPDNTPPWSSGLIEVWKRLAETVTWTNETYDQAIADALRGPLKAFGVNADFMRQRGDLTLYITAMIPALLVLPGEIERGVLEEDEIPLGAGYDYLYNLNSNKEE